MINIFLNGGPFMMLLLILLGIIIFISVKNGIFLLLQFEFSELPFFDILFDAADNV